MMLDGLSTNLKLRGPHCASAKLAQTRGTSQETIPSCAFGSEPYQLEMAVPDVWLSPAVISLVDDHHITN